MIFCIVSLSLPHFPFDGTFCIAYVLCVPPKEVLQAAGPTLSLLKALGYALLAFILKVRQQESLCLQQSHPARDGAPWAREGCGS